MVSEIIVPNQEIIELKVRLPGNYVGKKVHCLFYIDEDIEIGTILTSSDKKPSDFFGILGAEEGERFEKHTGDIRNEWNRDIQL